MVDIPTEIWKNKNNTELNQSKEEMVKRIVEKMKEKDLVVDFFWKKSVSKYLLDDENNKIRNFFTGVGLNILSVFSSSSKELKKIRENLSVIKTKTELNDLEKTIIDKLKESGNWQNTSISSNQITSYSSSSEETQKTNNSSIESEVDSVKVWEAARVEKSKRKNRLFPHGMPNNSEEMKKYLTKINVPILTSEWKETTLNLRIHKKLANEYKAIFKEMYDKRIPVNPSKTWWYNWRLVRGSKTKLSEHCFGWAVDLNWDVNGWVFGKTDRSSPYFNNNDTVNIWKRHGFYWWGDRKKRNDPMHFTYMGW